MSLPARLATCLCTWFLALGAASAADGAAPLPDAVADALEEREVELLEAQVAYRERVVEANDAAVRDLRRARERAEREGDLETAVAIRGLIAEYEESGPEPATDLLGDPIPSGPGDP